MSSISVALVVTVASGLIAAGPSAAATSLTAADSPFTPAITVTAPTYYYASASVPDSTVCSGDCSSASDPCDLRGALADAVTSADTNPGVNSVISLAPGTY